jgi:hypothetical protein
VPTATNSTKQQFSSLEIEGKTTACTETFTLPMPSVVICSLYFAQLLQSVSPRTHLEQELDKYTRRGCSFLLRELNLGQYCPSDGVSAEQVRKEFSDVAQLVCLKPVTEFERSHKCVFKGCPEKHKTL